MTSRLLTASAAAVALFGIVGCANVPTAPYPEAAAKFSKLNARDGRIFVYRSSGLGGLVMPAVYLSGEQVGRAIPRQVFFVDRPAGSYEITTATEVERKVTFSLTAGEEKYVRLSPSFGLMIGRINPELVSKTEAEEELKELDFVLPATK
jgi:hypothetical protein